MASAPDDERACDDEVRALTPDKHGDDDYNPFDQRSRQARPSPCRARRPPPCDDYRAVAKRMKLSIKVPSPVEFTRNPSIETHRPTKKYPVGVALPAFRLPATIAFDDEPYPRQPTTLLEALTL